MKRHVTRAEFSCAALACAAALVSACSVPAPYIPSVVGDVGPRQSPDQLEARIAAREDSAKVGTPIVFDIRLRNLSEHSYWIPRDPNVRFHFTYANGVRDNYLSDVADARHFEHHEVVRLDPGEELITSFEVKTYYFERTGITEFYAVLDLARNTNPGIAPSWHGQLQSNAYGVLVNPPDNRIGSFLFGQAPRNGVPST